MNIRDSIEKTKQGFEESFKADSFYNKQTRDERHLKLILACLKVEPGMRVLDLGTGTGYLAFPLADKYKRAQVVGLDIVEAALAKNRRQAVVDRLDNLTFASYDGMKFPFDDASFDVIVTRYALHHFPAIRDTFGEISRVLKPGGTLFVSDPAPNDDDTERFVDEYMQMKKDGHIKFYTKQEWLDLATGAGLMYSEGFETTIRFPKKRAGALEFDDIVSRHPEAVVRGYGVEIIGDEIWITERVNNLLFTKTR